MEDKAGGQVTGAFGKSPVGSTGLGMDVLRHRRAKHSLRAQIMRELVGQNSGGPGLVAKALTKIGQLLDSPDPEMALDATDRVIRLLPYILEKEGEGLEQAGNALAKALSGGGPVQIVFGQHFHGRSSPDQPGQVLPSQVSPGMEAGASKSSPANDLDQPSPTKPA